MWRRRQHLETLSFTGKEPKPTVVVTTGAAWASTSGDGELNKEKTEANCCWTLHRFRCRQRLFLVSVPSCRRTPSKALIGVRAREGQTVDERITWSCAATKVMRSAVERWRPQGMSKPAHRTGSRSTVLRRANLSHSATRRKRQQTRTTLREEKKRKENNKKILSNVRRWTKMAMSL